MSVRRLVWTQHAAGRPDGRLVAFSSSEWLNDEKLGGELVVSSASHRTIIDLNQSLHAGRSLNLGRSAGVDQLPSSLCCIRCCVSVMLRCLVLNLGRWSSEMLEALLKPDLFKYLETYL